MALDSKNTLTLTQIPIKNGHEEQSLSLLCLFGLVSQGVLFWAYI